MSFVKDWNDLKKFKDEIGTEFTKLPKADTYDYLFVTKEGEVDYCYKWQMVEWRVQLGEQI